MNASRASGAGGSAHPEQPAHDRAAPASGRLRVLRNGPRGADLHELALLAPAGWGPARAGQFVQIECPPCEFFGFRRPFSLAGCRPAAGGIELRILYGAVGRRTRRLAEVRPGGELEVAGPFGRPFTLHPDLRPVGIGGGRGVAPLLMLAEQWTEARAAAGDGGSGEAEGGLLLYGARTSSLLLPLEGAPWEVRLATDDGSAGFAGTLVELAEALALEGRLRPERDALYACGPNAMLGALSRWAGARGFSCQVSLETSFGCGFGVCAGCAVPVRPRPPEGIVATPVAGADDPSAEARAPGLGEASGGDAFDRYVFACREGPVFESWRVEWEGVHE